MPTPPQTVREALASLADAKPMRRRSLCERYVKCSKPGCPCGQTLDARHGPYYSLTRAVAGSTRSRLLTAARVAKVREQIEAAHRFRKRVDAYWEACEQWADAELGASSSEGAEKGGSRPPSRSSPDAAAS